MYVCVYMYIYIYEAQHVQRLIPYDKNHWIILKNLVDEECDVSKCEAHHVQRMNDFVCNKY